MHLPPSQSDAALLEYVVVNGNDTTRVEQYQLVDLLVAALGLALSRQLASRLTVSRPEGTFLVASSNPLVLHRRLHRSIVHEHMIVEIVLADALEHHRVDGVAHRHRAAVDDEDLQLGAHWACSAEDELQGLGVDEGAEHVGELLHQVSIHYL